MVLQVDQQIIFGPHNCSIGSITTWAVERIPRELGLTCNTGITAKIVKDSGWVGLVYGVTSMVKCLRVVVTLTVAIDKDHCTAGQTRSKWPKTQTSAGKFLASIFGDVQGILFINYLEKGRTINSKYYIALMVHLKEEITKKMATNEEEKKCSFTKTMHHVTSWSQWWQNYMNCTSNNSPGWLVVWVLWHINLCRLFNAKFCLYVLHLQVSKHHN